MFPIVAHNELAPKVHRMSVKAPLVAQKCKPGQFVILIIDEEGERVPFTVSGWDAETGTVDFVYIEVGKTTNQLGTLKAGDHLAHFVGPLGKPSEVDHYGHVAAVASGYGVAAIVPILKGLKEKKNRITTVLQAPDRERCFGQSELERVSDRLILAIGAIGENMSTSATQPVRKLLANLAQSPVDRVILMGSLYVLCESSAK